MAPRVMTVSGPIPPDKLGFTLPGCTPRRLVECFEIGVAEREFLQLQKQIRKALKSPFNFGERDLSLTASIGVTIYDGNPVAGEDVLRDAELAMYYAKRLGGDRIEAYRASARSIVSRATPIAAPTRSRPSAFLLAFGYFTAFWMSLTVMSPFRR